MQLHVIFLALNVVYFLYLTMQKFSKNRGPEQSETLLLLLGKQLF